MNGIVTNLEGHELKTHPPRCRTLTPAIVARTGRDTLWCATTGLLRVIVIAAAQTSTNAPPSKSTIHKVQQKTEQGDAKAQRLLGDCYACGISGIAI